MNKKQLTVLCSVLIVMLFYSGCSTVPKSLRVTALAAKSYRFSKRSKIVVFEAREDEGNLTSGKFRRMLKQELKSMGCRVVDQAKDADLCLTFKLVNKLIPGGNGYYNVQYLYLFLHTKKDRRGHDEIVWRGRVEVEADAFRKSPELCVRRVLKYFGSNYSGSAPEEPKRQKVTRIVR